MIKSGGKQFKADLKETQSTFNPANPLGKPAVKYTRPEDIHLKSADEEKYPGKKIHKKTLRFDIEKLIGEKPFNLTLIDFIQTLMSLGQ